MLYLWIKTMCCILRTDRYEGKPAYWVETELEAEWEKTTSRSKKETAEYEVETSASDAMLQAATPLSLDVRSLANEGLGITLHFFYHCLRYKNVVVYDDCCSNIFIPETLMHNYTLIWVTNSSAASIIHPVRYVIVGRCSRSTKASGCWPHRASTGFEK